MKSSYNIATINGDGIGHEIVPLATDVMRTVAALSGQYWTAARSDSRCTTTALRAAGPS